MASTHGGESCVCAVPSRAGRYKAPIQVFVFFSLKMQFIDPRVFCGVS